jgi:hypothetical protein
MSLFGLFFTVLCAVASHGGTSIIVVEDMHGS